LSEHEKDSFRCRKGDFEDRYPADRAWWDRYFYHGYHGRTGPSRVVPPAGFSGHFL
jgi:hypothetical protein